jgi:Helix-turn-helix domain
MYLPDAALALRVSYPVALRLALTGELETRREGRRWVITAESVEAYHARQQSLAGTGPGEAA